MKAAKETDLVRVILEYLHMRRIFAWKNATTGVYDPARKKFRTFQGLKGVSDILGIVDAGFSTGRFLAIEAKVKPNKCSPEQEAFLANVRERGGIGIVAYSIDDVERGLRDAGV